MRSIHQGTKLTEVGESLQDGVTPTDYWTTVPVRFVGAEGVSAAELG